jgi:hypothetical protein
MAGGIYPAPHYAPRAAEMANRAAGRGQRPVNVSFAAAKLSVRSGTCHSSFTSRS